jgi:hypothetical protein
MTYISPDKLPIWQIWFQGKDYASPIVKLYFQSIDKYSNGREIIRLTEKIIWSILNCQNI